MNEDQIMGNWHEIKGKVTAKWGELTDDEVAEAKGELEQLAGKIQQKYGGTKAEIHRQLQEF
ncbi:MAG: CsbD family protein [Chloroflexi bacterium]|nr:CsbD family protein [Chloroflexota bacterium]